MKPLGALTMQVLYTLDDVGPLSSYDMALLLNRTQLSIGGSLRRLRKRKLIHITKYERQPDGQKGRCIPIYAVGDVPDAPPLKRIGVLEVNKKYRKRHAAIISARRYVTERKQLGVWGGLV